MIKSISAMKNIQDVCSKLRIKYYGTAASITDYKDSFVINNAIDLFNDKPEVLMSNEISKQDLEVKTSKSINFRSNCYEKLSTLAKLLNIPEAEVCRRILYHSLESSDTAASSQMKMVVLMGKIKLLKSQIALCAETLEEIMLEITLVEGEQSDVL